MAVALKTINVSNPELREVQANVAAAIDALSSQPAQTVGVIQVAANTKLVGNEDVVLVDASAATAAIAIVLPSPKALRRAVTVKVIKAGNFPVVVKAVDIAQTASPTIDGGASVSIPANAAGRVVVVSNGTNFFTVT